MQCCSSAEDGFGGYEAPKVPEVGACKAVAVEGAQKIVAQFPGRTREIFCTRDCEDGSTSEHCTGKAMDMMCADGGGVSDRIPFPSRRVRTCVSLTNTR
ncbi:hypothetical protein IMZ48_26825 [Candidatus Bathyarchaeota archaeon]|nr:hypothetical protein [Candidatus Bathyarchaeota archaeon]